MKPNKAASDPTDGEFWREDEAKKASYSFANATGLFGMIPCSSDTTTFEFKDFLKTVYRIGVGYYLFLEAESAMTQRERYAKFFVDVKVDRRSERGRLYDLTMPRLELPAYGPKTTAAPSASRGALTFADAGFDVELPEELSQQPMLHRLK